MGASFADPAKALWEIITWKNIFPWKLPTLTIFPILIAYYFSLFHNIISACSVCLPYEIFLTYQLVLHLFSPIVSLHWEDFRQASQEIQEIPDTRDLDVHQENTCIYEKEKENDRIYKSQVNDCIYKPTCNNYNCWTFS